MGKDRKGVWMKADDWAEAGRGLGPWINRYPFTWQMCPEHQLWTRNYWRCQDTRGNQTNEDICLVDLIC